MIRLADMLETQEIDPSRAIARIAATTGESRQAVSMRFWRWRNGSPPRFDVGIRDLEALGFVVRVDWGEGADLSVCLPRPGFAQELRSFRKASGLSMREVARRSGVSAAYISKIEQGQANPTVGVVERIEKVLNSRGSQSER